MVVSSLCAALQSFRSNLLRKCGIVYGNEFIIRLRKSVFRPKNVMYVADFAVLPET